MDAEHNIEYSKCVASGATLWRDLHFLVVERADLCRNLLLRGVAGFHFRFLAARRFRPAVGRIRFQRMDGQTFRGRVGLGSLVGIVAFFRRVLVWRAAENVAIEFRNAFMRSRLDRFSVNQQRFLAPLLGRFVAGTRAFGT